MMKPNTFHNTSNVTSPRHKLSYNFEHIAETLLQYYSTGYVFLPPGIFPFGFQVDEHASGASADMAFVELREGLVDARKLITDEQVDLVLGGKDGTEAENSDGESDVSDNSGSAMTFGGSVVTDKPKKFAKPIKIKGGKGGLGKGGFGKGGQCLMFFFAIVVLAAVASCKLLWACVSNSSLVVIVVVE
jgi:hypothetical protein